MDIQIRHSNQSDFIAIKQIYEQKSCYAGTLQLPFPSEDIWQKKLENWPDNVHSLVAMVDKKICGQINIEHFISPRRKHVASLGMGVSEAYQGKGVGSKLLEAILELATNWLAITRIELEVYTDNQAGIALYEKFGFSIEGTAKSYAFRNGEYVDVYFMAKVTL
ncbi:GNAT family N-acetyltransferase [Pseudoalteromonas sp. C2R02]|uniref:GNAT family N-acetyltransferase n=1 Tax=Pseudoalteromonas sp. C2R02 TaxID=2841565 RepID=UPI001C09ADE6|nr:GNAT family N-acetyltransferase [Pseudoalteromonas sp. C2R02]MBU2969162.1 GNAT family N-acetyltransferase [Pseudoalteromonas sp. C2R02]